MLPLLLALHVLAAEPASSAGGTPVLPEVPETDATDVEDPTRYAGRLISSVVLVAGEGTLPEADLEPLLRMSGERRLDLSVIALDLRTLYRVAPIAAVEAEVSPAPVFDPDLDDVVEGVSVRYVLYPAIRVSGVRVQGAQQMPAKRVAGAARLRRGDAFDPDQDAAVVADRVQSWLAHEGYPDARVEVGSYPEDDDPFQHEVWIRVDEGPPRTVGTIRLSGVPEPLTDKQVRRWMKQAGLQEGKPLADEALTRARLTLRQKLARLGQDGFSEDLLGPRTLAWLRARGVLSPFAGGWVEASVRVQSEPVGDGAWDVDVQIEPGPRLVVQTEGISVPEAQEALGIDERYRLTRGFIEAAPERLESALAREGYQEAQAEVFIEEGEDATILHVRVTPGPRYRRRAFRFVGNQALSDTQLRTVFNQASPEVLKRRRLTDDSLQDAIDAAEDLYHSIGYAQATLTPRPAEEGRRVPILTLDRSRRWVRVTLDVDEGPETTLLGVDVTGAAPDVELAWVDQTTAELEGGPFSPQGLQSLAQRIVQAHRARGYLTAQARVRTSDPSDDAVSATISVAPGEQILMRSFATRGNRRVDSPFLRRTVAPELGTPITARVLDTLRQDLYDLGMFSSLEVSVLGDGSARDLVVDLQERPRHTIEAGVGLASDQGVRALGRWTWRNLLGPADRLDTNGLLGLRFAAGAGLGGLPGFRNLEYRLGTNYLTPLGKRSSLTLTAVGLEEIQERNWRSLRRALGAQIELHPSNAGRFQVALRLEHRRLADADPGALLPNDIWRSERLALPEDPSVDTRGRLVDLLEIIWLDDRRDNPLQPTRGGLYQARVAFSPGLVEWARGGQGVDNLRVPTLAAEARHQRVVPLGPLSLQLAAEAGVQGVLPLGAVRTFTVDGQEVRPAVPVEQRYRLGGTASLRGFRRDGVGAAQKVRQLDLAWPDGLAPVVSQQIRSDDVRWVPTGGDTYARATADLLIPLPVLGLADWEGYAVALFVDAGQVLFIDPQTVVSSALEPQAPLLRVGTGLGLRVATPVGPLQADLAFNPQAIAQGKDGLLRSEWEEPVARLHLSLGTLF